MAYKTTTDAQGNITSLRLENPAIGNVSAKSGDIPIPSQGEVFLIGASNDKKNEMQVAIRVGNEIRILSGVYGQGGATGGIDVASVLKQLGLDLNSVNVYNGGDISGAYGSTGLYQVDIGDYKSGTVEGNVKSFVDTAKQSIKNVGSKTTSPTFTGGEGSNVGSYGQTNQPTGTVQTAMTGGQTGSPTSTGSTGWDLNSLLQDQRVKNTQGMADWLQGNATLFPKLKQLGYTDTDIINEAYSWLTRNKSAFSKDMTTTPRGENVASAAAPSQTTGGTPPAGTSGDSGTTALGTSISSPTVPEGSTLDDTTYVNGAGLIKFSTDVDGNGPLNQSTVFYVDPNTKTLRPFISAQAFDTFFQSTGLTLQQASSQGLIQTLSPNAQGSYKLLTLDDAIQNDGTFKQAAPTIDQAALQSGYGKSMADQDPATLSAVFKGIEGLFTLIENDPNSGISPEVLNEIKNDPATIALYFQASVLGGYSVTDILKDIIRKQQVKNGNTDLANVKIISENQTADQYYATADGAAARNNPLLNIPASLGGIATNLLNSPIMDIMSAAPELYQQLVPPLDWNSPEMQAELDKIKSAYHDVLLQQVEATTTQEKSLADYSYNQLKDELNKKYGITLSDNATEAWNQINTLGQNLQQRGLTGSGLQQEATDKYLQERRKLDERLRTAQVTEQDKSDLEYMTKYGTSDQLKSYLASVDQKLSDPNLTPEQRTSLQNIKTVFTPDAETLSFFSKENLKAKYPDIPDSTLDLYANWLVDPTTGLYRSSLYQTMYANKFKIATGTEMGTVSEGYDVLKQRLAQEQKALEEQKAYEPYALAEIGEKPAITPSASQPSITYPNISQTTPAPTQPTDNYFQGVEGTIYKNQTNPDMFLYKSGKLNWIENEDVWKKLYGTKPMEGSYQPLPTDKKYNFGNTITGTNYNQYL